jgi:hypothetical protein
MTGQGAFTRFSAVVPIPEQRIGNQAFQLCWMSGRLKHGRALVLNLENAAPHAEVNVSEGRK